MPKIMCVLDSDVEIELRKRIRKKGDLSRIINNSLRMYFNFEPEKDATQCK